MTHLDTHKTSLLKLGQSRSETVLGCGIIDSWATISAEIVIYWEKLC